MFNFFKKKHVNYPEAVIASDWWASKLLDPTVKYYSGPISFSVQKDKIPSKESVAVFKSGLINFLNNSLETCLDSYPFGLCISSSDEAMKKIALESDIDDFESHFGKGAIMFIDYDDVSVKEVGKKCFKIRK